MERIGITMGCPVGIGPEIILKLFHACTQKNNASLVVIGDLKTLIHQAKHFQLDVACKAWIPGEEILPDIIPVFDISKLHPEKLTWGKPTPETGLAMASYIEHAVKLVQDGVIDGITTCPITKYSLQQAGYNYPGHTEMLADLSGDRHFTMMMAGTKLRVTLVTIHCSFDTIVTSLSQDSIYQRICITHSSLKTDFALSSPRIAVAGLNPHASEGGVFGNEESLLIKPAIERARNEGMNVSGPFPPDTVFLNASTGHYDAVVCMYHDQGLIPFKLLHFSDGVNVTIGLSLVRTSVDHGTAYDIAGKGIARTESLAAAIKMAAEIAQNRKKIDR